MQCKNLDDITSKTKICTALMNQFIHIHRLQEVLVIKHGKAYDLRKRTTRSLGREGVHKLKKVKTLSSSKSQ